jgi:hypothetical protein
MTKEDTIQGLIFAYGKLLPAKNWFIHEDGEVYQSEGITFKHHLDHWWFLDKHGEPINSNWTGACGAEDDYPSIHEDSLFETEAEAKEAAQHYLEREIERLQKLVLKLKQGDQP